MARRAGSPVHACGTNGGRREEVPAPDQASFTTSCARISNDLLRAAWSKICAVTINSSAPVARRTRCSPCRTVSGPPTTEQGQRVRQHRAPVRVEPRFEIIDRRRQLPRPAAAQVHERLLQRGKQPPRLRIRIRREHVDTQHDVRRRAAAPTAGTVRGRSPTASLICPGAKCEAKA